MSGGHFDYQQARIEDIADAMQDALDGADGEAQGLESEAVRAKFHEGIRLLRLAYIHAQRADWLLSGDDGPETYLADLAKELAAVEAEFKDKNG